MDMKFLWTNKIENLASGTSCKRQHGKLPDGGAHSGMLGNVSLASEKNALICSICPFLSFKRPL